MTTLRLTAPSRLHFGLLARGPAAPRQFGGLGLMVDAPGLEIEATASEAWTAAGPLADRALRVAESVSSALVQREARLTPLHFAIRRAPPEHVGLGTGTQLSLAVAKLIVASIELADTPAPDLAVLCGRGVRSGVGLHGFDVGGLVIEGGHKTDGGVAPLLCRLDFPPEWSALVVAPRAADGLHGAAESRAFAALPPMPESETDRLCRLVLLGVLPAVVERHLIDFGAALEEIQHRVGSWFAPAQGGVFASTRLAEIVAWLRSEGLRGVGQSSWGPTLYGFSDDGPGWRDSLLLRLRDRFDLSGAGLWTVASRAGARIATIGS
jgi:beta-ribofuranosylaminobenzene 5'-phosphate synthase